MRAATILLVTVCILLVWQVSADTALNDAEQTVRGATLDIYAALEVQNKAGRTRETLFQLVNEILLPHADLKQMSRWA